MSPVTKLRQRLFLQIWAGFALVALLCGATAGLTATAIHRGIGQVPVADYAVYEADGQLLAGNAELPSPQDEQGWYGGHDGRGAVLELQDGRWISIAWDREVPGAHVFVPLMVALAMGLGCWPLARRVTRRLEALEAGTEAWSSGELSARVPVEGIDEVAQLASSFNRAAARIEELVTAQRTMLASASHELRSPLARIRMALEILGDGAQLDPAERIRWLGGATKDIAELDELIEDLLLASRLHLAKRGREPVDVLVLLVEESARLGLVAEGDALTVEGDAKALRRALRNLLENAQRHGSPPVEARIHGHTVVVEDRGPGVPDELRERIFEPFFRPAGHAEGADGGVGFGLALVRRVAEAHGGTAVCGERSGGGARFELTLG